VTSGPSLRIAINERNLQEMVLLRRLDVERGEAVTDVGLIPRQRLIDPFHGE